MNAREFYWKIMNSKLITNFAKKAIEDEGFIWKDYWTIKDNKDEFIYGIEYSRNMYITSPESYSIGASNAKELINSHIQKMKKILNNCVKDAKLNDIIIKSDIETKKISIMKEKQRGYPFYTWYIPTKVYINIIFKIKKGMLTDSVKDARLLKLIKMHDTPNQYNNTKEAITDIYNWSKSNLNNKKYIIRIDKENIEHTSYNFKLKGNTITFDIEPTKQQDKKQLNYDVLDKLDGIMNSQSSQNPYNIIAKNIVKQFRSKLDASLMGFYSDYINDKDSVFTADNGWDDNDYPCANCEIKIIDWNK